MSQTCHVNILPIMVMLVLLLIGNRLEKLVEIMIRGGHNEKVWLYPLEDILEYLFMSV